MKYKNCILLSGNANQSLGDEICDQYAGRIKNGAIYHHQFPSGEWYCQIKENIRGADVFLLQSIIQPANDNLVQLLIMADAARRSSAARITAVIPYFGYSRQDRKDKPRVPISAKLVANMLVAAGIDRVLTMDLHAQQIQGFFDIPVDHLLFRPVLLDALKEKNIQVVVAPDTGALKKAEEIASYMKVDLAFVSKKRKSDTEIEVTQFVGDVKDKNVLIIDDLTESAGTICGAAECCKYNGATNVFAAVSHNCVTSVGSDRLNQSFNKGIINGFYTSNTANGSITKGSKVEIVSVAPLFAKAISYVNLDMSITSLFE